jgi:hypothetical protein
MLFFSTGEIQFDVFAALTCSRQALAQLVKSQGFGTMAVVLVQTAPRWLRIAIRAC